MWSSVCLALLVCGLGLVAGDTPANCTYDETRGWWTFTEGPRDGDRNVDCDNWTPVSVTWEVPRVDRFHHFGGLFNSAHYAIAPLRNIRDGSRVVPEFPERVPIHGHYPPFPRGCGASIYHHFYDFVITAEVLVCIAPRGSSAAPRQGRDATKIRVFLEFPNLATDDLGNRGTWTLIYNQGFEVVINFRRYFAFSNYSRSESFCSSTKAGWAHDILGHNWACFEGRRDGSVQQGKPLQAEPLRRAVGDTVDPFNSEEFVALLNKAQSSWTAKVHEPFRGKTLNEMMSIRGGHRNRNFRNPPPAPVTEEQRKLASALPEKFDWRNVSGVNYVSPVRNQGGCGSCYAFASMALLESRLRIATNNKVQRVFSPQDVVSCSPYSQGCSGGFPYLIGGKYAQDYGVVDEECNRYTGQDGPCKTKPNCTRHYAAKYRYCGGYYGAVFLALCFFNNAIPTGPPIHPIAMRLLLGAPFDPFELTNHAVLVIGYGFDEASQLPYWTVKNSWGTGWGEDGFFRIRRGSDECGIESLAVEVEPIP
ncbi:hypothetical protein HPB49_007726 [Dermacentor silvarum]|uniref:Uncharacterized protein n=1 Tax=Dermacentor silvarum TaxID=543639 RepID=A0ACB8C2J3_DERSI|nr:hypothetical protein HPB49_007726 [Dermacentor silvarum]